MFQILGILLSDGEYRAVVENAWARKDWDDLPKNEKRKIINRIKGDEKRKIINRIKGVEGEESKE